MDAETDVLVVGAGPVGLTAAVELHRRGVSVRIVDQLAAALPYAKAVGVQPRTLEIWAAMGLVRQALDAAVPMRGQIAYVNGAEAGRLALDVPPDVPYGFVALPQYETERILAGYLSEHGVEVERGLSLTSFAQDAQAVTARLAGAAGQQTVRARYLVGCDGAHSTVRRGLGLAFLGDAFPEQYMLGDVEVDWSLPPGWAVRAMHQTDGKVDDLLVCIPLPGRGRYRMSMLVPPDLQTPAARRDDVAHGLEADRPAPTLGHIQAVLDRLAPEPTTARNLRWSSVFRISHRLVERYSVGRVFLAGDAAHVHPPDRRAGHEHRHPGRVEPGLEARPRRARRGRARPARQLQPGALAGRGGGGRAHGAARPGGLRRGRLRRVAADPAGGPAARGLPRQRVGGPGPAARRRRQSGAGRAGRRSSGRRTAVGVRTAAG